MPSRPPLAPRTIPGRLAGLGALPKRKIAAIPLLRSGPSPFTLLLFRVAVAQLAITGVFGNVEEDVSAAGVGKTLVDERFGECDDPRHVLRRFGYMVDLVH